MRGMNVCYHHGGKSRHGFLHPNHKYGFYSKSPMTQVHLLLAFEAYRRALRRQQIAEIYDQLAATAPRQTRADERRFMAAVRAAARQLPVIKLTPELAALVIR